METSQPCQNGYQYLVTTSKKTQYCSAGSVTHLDLFSGAVVSLQVQPKLPVQMVLFQASAGPISKKHTTQLICGAKYD